MYNEKIRIGGVLSVLLTVPEIGEIICVDDASSDGSGTYVQKKFPTIDVIVHDANKGKSGAIKTGTLAAQYDDVFTCDGDLVWLQQEELSAAIQTYFAYDMDMVILKRINAPVHIKLFRGATLTSGERIIKKKYLLDILRQPIKNLTLDCLMNKYMMEQNKKCIWMPSSGINIFKSAKYGLRAWLKKDLEMYSEMELIKNKFPEQILRFCKNTYIPEKGIIEHVMDVVTLQK